MARNQRLLKDLLLLGMCQWQRLKQFFKAALIIIWLNTRNIAESRKGLIMLVSVIKKIFNLYKTSFKYQTYSKSICGFFLHIGHPSFKLTGNYRETLTIPCPLSSFIHKLYIYLFLFTFLFKKQTLKLIQVIGYEQHKTFVKEF